MSYETPSTVSEREAALDLPGARVPPARPPVFVLNPYYTGLGIARSLRGTGVRVEALYSEGDAPGLRSRHFAAVRRVPNGRDDPRGLRDALVRLATGLPCKP